MRREITQRNTLMKFLIESNNMEIALKGIFYKNNTDFEIVDDVNFYINQFFGDKNIDYDSILFINLINGYHTNFSHFTNHTIIHPDSITTISGRDELIKGIETVLTQRNIKVIVYIFNETLVDSTVDLDFIRDKFNINYYICNYDLNKKDNDNYLLFPGSIYSQIAYLHDNGFRDAIPFLKSMNEQTRDLQKPFKLAFYSKHINPIRIDIFNLLKKHNVLKESTWSFHKMEEYYSRERHDLDEFYKENEGLIPYSFDYFSDEKNSLKHTYFSQWLTYFEILTESYFLKTAINMDIHCPMTEKIVKPILSALPFIIFGPPTLKKGLESIGLTFESPLYGFYDISDIDEVNDGLVHVERQITMSKEELHSVYFDGIDEYHRNLDLFEEFFHKNSRRIEEKLESIG